MLLSRRFYLQFIRQTPTVTATYCTNIVKSCKTMSLSRQILLLSSSNCHGYNTLEFAKEEICSFLNKNNVKDLIFIPYAKLNHDTYTEKIREVIGPWGYNVNGLHTYPDPVTAIDNAKAIFVGGGNTFLLLKELYEHQLVNIIKQRVLGGSLLYIGSSAGTNVAARSINTTNDMPIIYPPSFDGCGLIKFNINPHYIEASNIYHKGETRDQRIEEFMEMPHHCPVLGLREGAILVINGNTLTIKGVAGAVLFKRNEAKIEYPVGADVSFLADIV